ncbi:MAG: hypothetical protein VX895_06865 [Chloroflexota bacterium]|nr:hypothetical protein [Chloroflexota bacterium]
MTTEKRVPVPLVFSLVLILVFALIIFFGAWAVSADVGNQRKLAFGRPGTTAVDSSANLVDPAGGHDPAADTWWGKAFLSACPLH